ITDRTGKSLLDWQPTSSHLLGESRMLFQFFFPSLRGLPTDGQLQTPIPTGGKLQGDSRMFGK
ncbi:hypothetical protein RPN13_11710, partial [Staphylococcus aureus]|nr:hypothetical protein [Staphylococcus aureus]